MTTLCDIPDGQLAIIRQSEIVRCVERATISGHLLVKVEHIDFSTRTNELLTGEEPATAYLAPQ